MSDTHNTQGPEGNYDPAGSTQMFRAFVEEAAPSGPAGPGARMQQRAAQQKSGSKAGVWLGLAAVVVIGVVIWLAVR
ncbi:MULTISPECIES: hypothetical protein [unclassified Streptomyces]|uniref:hypothetical protein n=1 Tax=unclassified Streptomyces TaxID=2593676 RepID=UPI001BE97011|nr:MULTISPECIES: hypothetical protein [unclassified Streptomyces]MBT2404152.1 hypothetical protein [Streptomyces sp. ISL-21]MBT2458955.1 hypothetical protein [Streptomyces sp. ISL-86]MBT2607168.1 hypothetical protein [Streptomyces sp. ISL-87]